MATNIRQLKVQLGVSSDQITTAGRSLNIDVSNHGRNLTPQEEDRLRRYFAGDQQSQAPQSSSSPNEPVAIHAAGQALTQLADTMALGYATGFPELVIGRTMQMLNTQSPSALRAQLAERTGQSVTDRDWNSDVQEGLINPFLQQLNQGLDNFSLRPIEEVNPLLPLPSSITNSLPSAAESASSVEPAASPESVEAQSPEPSSPLS